VDPISSIDRVVLLLRERLRERSSVTSGRRAGADRLRSERRSVDAMAAISGVTDEQLKRALVQRLLCDHFGDDLVNDASFQAVVDQVMQSLQTEASVSQLLDGAVSDLRKAAAR
jgi:hypothetical protein